jgi:hypothetical protein
MMYKANHKPVRTSMALHNHWWKKLPWLTVIGAVAMFLSWILQYHFAAEATGARLYLERSQLSIDLQQIRMEQWHILYLQEKAKPTPDQQVLLASAFKSLQAYLNLAAWSSARVREDDVSAAKDIDEKNAVQVNLIALYKAGDLNALEKDLRTTGLIESRFDLANIWGAAFHKKLYEVKCRENRYTMLFVSTFALGGLVAAWDFMSRIRNAARDGAAQPVNSADAKKPRR